jgi:two-component system, cell cycle response regulator
VNPPPPGPGRRPPDARSAEPRDAEIEELRGRLRRLAEEAAENEKKLKRAQERQLELLAAETLPDLFRVVTRSLVVSYALDAVTLVLEDPQHEIRHLMLGTGDHPDDFPGVLFVDALGALAPQFASLHRPWLGKFVRPDHGLLFAGPLQKDLQSLALVPLRRHGRCVGVLCFGSRDPERFTHRHGSDFLQHLGSIVAVCVENAANRARVLKSGLADYLTGWHTRRYLHARLREELARAQRQGGHVACLMIDVDWFKQINDTYGHLGGDEAIREIAQRIEAQIRASDTAARFGGDEFSLLLPDTTLADAGRLAGRIRVAVTAAPIELGQGQCHRVTLSIGVAAVAPTRADADLKSLADRLLADADAALYRAKAAGRDRFVSAAEERAADAPSGDRGPAA